MTSSPNTLLAIEDLSIHFGGLAALSKVSLELHPGEVVGIIGPNGAGKTTLFNSISGVVQGEGKFAIDGQARSWPKPHELIDLGIARTLQGVGLFPDLTVLENVMIGATKFAKGGLIRAALGFDSRQEAQLRERAMVALENVYAAGLADRLVSTLPYQSPSALPLRAHLSANHEFCYSMNLPAASAPKILNGWLISSITSRLNAQCS